MFDTHDLISPMQPVRLPARSVGTVMTGQAAVEDHARYDEMRLMVYAEREVNADKIKIRRNERTVAMRFDSVGYFNQVYHLDEESVRQLEEWEAFFDGVAAPPKFYIAADANRAVVAEQLAGAGLRVDTSVVRLGLEADAITVDRVVVPPDVSVEAVGPDGVEEFFHTYLDAFEADPAEAKRAEAVANMRRLYGRDGLWFFLARWRGRAAGVGALWCVNGNASLCGGATGKEFRDCGVHRALIQERLRSIAIMGGRWVSAWAEKGSRSHRNMIRAGFQLLVEDQVWRRPTAAAYP